MKKYAIETEMLKYPQRMLISSFKLENGTVITPLFNFTWNSDCSEPKLTVLFNNLLRKALIIAFSR